VGVAALVAVLATGTFAVSNGSTITTIASTSAAAFSGDGSPANLAQLSLPFGVSVDGNANAYIGDSFKHRVGRVGDASVPAVSSRCSRATAGQLVEKHRLNHFLLPDPVAQLLCGPFTGPGSDAMAVTIYAPTCWPIQNWGVFRFAQGVWKLVLDQPAYLVPPLVAVGSDIRETTAIHRPGDSRCLPSGGTHARMWRWNGKRLVAGPWKQVTPLPPVAGKTVIVSVASGTVACSRGGASFAKVTAATQFSVGAECDTSKGALLLTSAGPGGKTQTGRFSGGRFVVTQRKGVIPVTVLTLSGPLVPCTDCRAPSRAGSKRRRERHVFGHGKGRFETKGKYATVVAKGTTWETQDVPGATVVRVTSGTVLVTDMVKHKRVTVGPHKSYVAKAKGKPTSGTAGAAFRSPTGNLSCQMAASSVYCQSVKLPHSVRLALDGRLTICRGSHCLGNPAENAPTLVYGRQITVGRFRCLSQRVGVRCAVIQSGKGFLINRDGVTPVRP
jgi:hypothetical protein